MNCQMMYKVLYKVITGKDTGLIFSSNINFEPAIGTVTKMRGGNFQVVSYSVIDN
jgi:hypothetical protein